MKYPIEIIRLTKWVVECEEMDEYGKPYWLNVGEGDDEKNALSAAEKYQSENAHSKLRIREINLTR